MIICTNHLIQRCFEKNDEVTITSQSGLAVCIEHTVAAEAPASRALTHQ
jgi:hypothetical protein